MSSRRLALLLSALWIVGAASSSQSNSDAGIDLQLVAIDDLTNVGRQGTFPNGINACAFETTAWA